MTAKNLTGERSGALVAISRLGRTKSGNAIWQAKCDCGSIVNISTGNFGVQQSCGCLQRKALSERRTSHGHTKGKRRTAEYSTWDGMVKRCTVKGYARYSDRGIQVCDRWLRGEAGITGFEWFLADMGKRPSSKHSLDRFPDNNGNYEPKNCRWATATEQQRNKSNNHLVEYRGSKMPITQAAELAGLNPATVFGRINLGWTEQQALNEPLCHPPTYQKNRGGALR